MNYTDYEQTILAEFDKIDKEYDIEYSQIKFNNCNEFDFDASNELRKQITNEEISIIASLIEA